MEETEPVIFVEGVGSNRPARSQFWPALENMSMYSLVIEDTGMREPHWHPFTAELGYVHRGEARMTILDPNGSTDTYTLKEGDMYYVPAGKIPKVEKASSDLISHVRCQRNVLTLHRNSLSPPDRKHRKPRHSFSCVL